MNLLKIALISCSALISLSAFSVKELTLEEKVGQLLMPCFRGEIANEDAKMLIQDVKVGGIIYYDWTNGLSSPEQVRNLSSGLQALTKANRSQIPLLIATDQEGGIVERLKGNGFTTFPGNLALAMSKNPEFAKKGAFAIGQELQDVGINMNLAPVVDVNCNPKNPVIGIRSFGPGVDDVIAFGREALRGYNGAGVIATLKHFPGHGDVHVDSHLDLPLIRKSMQELQLVELAPFLALAKDADAIMTAHLLVEALDRRHCSTLSKKTLKFLRKDLGFKEVIISDSLTMDGVLKQTKDEEEAAILALNAGCDILLFGGKLLQESNEISELTVSEIAGIHKAIITAVKTGRIQEKRINQAAKRILALKKKRLKKVSSKEIDYKGHQELAKTIAESALKVEGRDLKSYADKSVTIIAPQLLEKAIRQTSITSLGKTSTLCFFNDLNPSEEEKKIIEEQARSADVLVICSYNAWKNESQEAFIQSFVNGKKPVILIVTRDPSDRDLFPNANLVFKTFSPTAVSLQAVVDKLSM